MAKFLQRRKQNIFNKYFSFSIIIINFNILFVRNFRLAASAAATVAAAAVVVAVVLLDTFYLSNVVNVDSCVTIFLVARTRHTTRDSHTTTH